VIKALNILKIITINILIVIVLIIASDFILTKFNLIKLKAKFSGLSIVGFSSPPVYFQKTGKKDSLIIVAIGDSHLQVTDDNRKSHQCQALLDYLDSNNIPTKVITLATGGTSPVQQMFTYDEQIKKKGIKPDIILFQIYSGNDFAEILRDDDRPRIDFRADGTPDTVSINWIFFRLSNKNSSDYTSWPRDSRLLYLANAAIGHYNILLKTYASEKANELLHLSLFEEIEYIRNLSRFEDKRFGYPGAVPAQFLNQYYLMTKYPRQFKSETVPRMKYFLEYFKKTNPDIPCMFFYLPSAPAIGAMSDKSQKIYIDILKRSNLTNIDIPQMEHSLYEMSDSINRSVGKPFLMYNMTDTLSEANKMDGTQTFYDDPTLHVDTKARKVIGYYWGKEIIKYINSKK